METRRLPAPILYLYEVREVDVDEHLGEVAVLEERDVGGAADRGVQILRSTPKLNLALITVGGDMDMRVCTKYMDAVEAAGNTSLLVKAKNQAEIAAAFETVSAAMSAGVKEVL